MQDVAQSCGLLASTATTTASATPTAAAAPGSAAAATDTCWNSVVWPTTANVVDTVDITAHKPPTPVYPPYVYSKFFATRFMDRWYLAWNAAGTQYYAFGLFLLGSNLSPQGIPARVPVRSEQQQQISEERAYDTLLMTTKAGALYTIHIPTTAKAKPVVKLIRKSGWAAYESLVVHKCGVNGQPSSDSNSSSWVSSRRSENVRIHASSCSSKCQE
ncbi:hypothetical protein ACQPYH_04490 [Kribbella sp. CA-245084]|uniref:hypothetical protein n=1 Tax=Kribbella sp. CA-245084 TaxID=3239940 RepID=UPI003D8ABEF5